MKDVLNRVAKVVLRSSSVRHVARHVANRLDMAPWLFVPPGHFYSPIPALNDVRRDEQRLFPPVVPHELPGIALDEVRQLAMLDELQPYYDSQPFSAEKTSNLRYFFENPYYRYSDAIFLHCMIRHTRPRRIIEVGSGFSSCVMLDTSELFFDNRIACTFVEPYPERLRTLLRDDDLGRIEILDRRLQEITLDRFRALEANDILFIDSTHVSKIGSDVNYIFAEILPALCPGVYVHFHDIIYPFEYPKEWIYEGRAWTEAYCCGRFLPSTARTRLCSSIPSLNVSTATASYVRCPYALRVRAAASGSVALSDASTQSF